MTSVALLGSIKKIYPAEKVVIRFSQGEDSAVLLINRHDPFEDGLDIMSPYRLAIPEKDIIHSARNPDTVISLLEDAGFTEQTIATGLESSAMDMIMVVAHKQDLIEKEIEQSLQDRAGIKQTTLLAQFEDVKNDPEKLGQFLMGLYSGEESTKPVLSVVEDSEEESIDV